MSKKAVCAIFTLMIVVLSVSTLVLTKTQPAAITHSASPFSETQEKQTNNGVSTPILPSPTPTQSPIVTPSPTPVPSPTITPTPTSSPTIASKLTQTPTPSVTPIRGVPDTSASAITLPPLSMDGINSHTETYGTDADPNVITLGPKLGAHSGWPAYLTKMGMEFELGNATPILAPLDMVFIGFSDTSADYRIQDGVKQSPYNDLKLCFESTSPDWPGMIIVVYHLLSSPLLPGQKTDYSRGEWLSVVQTQGHVFYPYDDYVVAENGNASSYNALIGYTVKRGELIGFAGSVGTHSMASFCFKVSHASENPTVQKGNRYLHWVQPGSFFYWKSYSPEANFPSGVLAYPFESDGYKLPAEQHDVNFKCTSLK